MIQNRYLVVQMIGKGGMGEVYLAVDQRLGSAVALKRTFFADSSELGIAFEREARILGRLRHPVLPKVIDHFIENGDQYLIMEHISGDDVAKRLELAGKPFPLSWVMFWSDQLLDALSYIHSHEPPIIHRDIKPQNLKLTDENHIILLDFGLSKDFQTDSSGKGVNSASVAGYSPHFASMEQVRGTGTDARSDLYSLSATLYQLLTNQVPIDALTRADALLGGSEDPIVPLHELNKEVPTSISDVILKGIAIRQDDRFATAIDMQKALRRAFNQGDIQPKPDIEAKTMMMDREPVSSASKPIPKTPEAPEMETKIRTTKPEDPLNATLKMDVPLPPGNAPSIAPAPPPEAVAGEAKHQPEPSAAPAEAKPLAAAATAGVAVDPVRRAVSPAQKPGQPAKKGKSKTGLVIGALLALLVLGGLAAAGGWYLYNQNQASKAAQMPQNVPSPTVTPTPAVAAESNQNTNSNVTAQTDAVDSNSSDLSTDSSNVDKENTTAESPSKSTSVTTKPAQVTSKTKPDQAVKPKEKPAVKKGKDERTVILQ